MSHQVSMLQRRIQRARRGNTLVLVAAILVLLVIIASAYISRTQEERITAQSVQGSSQRDEFAESTALQIADFPAKALFPQNIWPFKVNSSVGTDPPGQPSGTLGVGTKLPDGHVVSGNQPRLPYDAGAWRYGPGNLIDADNNGIPDFPAKSHYAYTAAPYSTYPFTNWPDDYTVGSPWPNGHGSPQSLVLLGEGNPVGNPGFGDNRWLSSFEPFRLDLEGDGYFDKVDDPTLPTFGMFDPTNNGVPPAFGGPAALADRYDRFTHWLHLANISRADNSFRIVRDISNVTGSLVTDLDVPFEQWLPIRIDHNGNALFAPFSTVGFGSVIGYSRMDVDNLNNFMNRWSVWFTSGVVLGPNGNYATAYRGGTALGIPGNYYNFNDLDGNGVTLDWVDPITKVPQEQPQSEFISGTARHTVGRVLADADGDGYTDSFWFYVPTPNDLGIMRVMAVRIVDNQAMVNVNTASRFVPSELTNTGAIPIGVLPKSTIGVGPVDVALVGQNATIDPANTSFAQAANNWNVGIFDNPMNHTFAQLSTLYGGVHVSWYSQMWSDGIDASNPNSVSNNSRRTWLNELHIQGNSNFAANPNELAFRKDRMVYWRNAGLRPNDPLLGVTPFGLSDEIELRQYAGLNSPWLTSRLESTLTTNLIAGNVNGASVDQSSYSVLRGSLDAEETTIPLETESAGNAYKLNLRRVKDLRARLTTYNNVRVDSMPPWLWPNLHWTDDLVDSNGNGGFDAAEITDAKAKFVRDTRKIDLREPYVDTNNNGTIETAEILQQQRDLAKRCIRVFERSLARDTPSGSTVTYFGSTAADRLKTQMLARSLTASLLCARDFPYSSNGVANLQLPDAPIAPQLIPELADPTDNTRYFIGVEKQPFIMEAFIAHVYPKSRVDPSYAGPSGANDFVIPPPFAGAGEHFVDASSTPSTVVVVQIANPFNTPIRLTDFRLRVFGQSYNFAAAPNGPNLWLGPATEDKPRTAIVYAIAEQFSSDAGNDGSFRARWIDFLDLDPTDLFEDANTSYTDTILLNATKTAAAGNGWQVNDIDVYRNENIPAVELVRIVGSYPIVVDRIDNPNESAKNEYRDRMVELKNDPFAPPPAQFSYNPVDGTGVYSGIRIKDNDYYTVWGRVSRNWAWDVDGNLRIDPDEHNPRFAYSDRPDSDLSKSPFDGWPQSGAGDGKYRGDAFQATSDGVGNYQAPNQYQGNPALDPDVKPYVLRDYTDCFGKDRRHKPTFFTTQTVYDMDGNAQYNGFVYADNIPSGVIVNFGDKSGGLRDPDPNVASSVKDSDYYKAQGFDYPLQLSVKDANFDRVGELNDLFMWGPVVKINGAGVADTEYTFSEHLSDKKTDSPYPVAEGVMVNRLNVTDQTPVLPDQTISNVTAANAPNALAPAVPAGILHYDAFVCDSFGIPPYVDADGDGTIGDADDLNLLAYSNANGFNGRGTPGMINISDAPLEVMRAMPDMTRLVHESGVPGNNPFVRLPDAIYQYRERLGVQPTSGSFLPFLPGYADRGQGTFFKGMRGGRGIDALGELMLLKRSSPAGTPAAKDFMGSVLAPHDSGRIDYVGLDPFYQLDTANPNGPPILGYKYPGQPLNQFNQVDYTTLSGRLSIDTGDIVTDFTPPAGQVGRERDIVGGDAEERNLLFSALSNIATTRSDTFTVYLKIRTFRQNPTNGRWDATDPEMIIDDSRYVMLVDRSRVNSPTDKPEVLYLEKINN